MTYRTLAYVNTYCCSFTIFCFETPEYHSYSLLWYHRYPWLHCKCRTNSLISCQILVGHFNINSQMPITALNFPMEISKGKKHFLSFDIWCKLDFVYVEGRLTVGRMWVVRRDGVGRGLYMGPVNRQQAPFCQAPPWPFKHSFINKEESARENGFNSYRQYHPVWMANFQPEGMEGVNAWTHVAISRMRAGYWGCLKLTPQGNKNFRVYGLKAN